MARRKRFGNTLWEVFDTATWPGMDRRLLTLSRDHLGYRSTKAPLLVLFVPHCFMILGLLLSGPILAVLWLSGQQLPDDPLPLVLVGDRRLLAVTPWLEQAEALALRHALTQAVRASDQPTESSGSRT